MHKDAAGIDPDEGGTKLQCIRPDLETAQVSAQTRSRVTSSHELTCPCVGLISGISADKEFIPIHLSYE